MQLRHSIAPILGLGALAALAISPASAQSPQTFTFTFTADDYASPEFTDSNGTYYFNETGYVNQPLTLASGGVQIFSLDSDLSNSFAATPANSSAPYSVVDIAYFGLTFSYDSAALGTMPMDDAYTLDATEPYSQSIDFAGGNTVTYDVGNGLGLIVTMIASKSNREATAILSPLAAPEPSQCATLGIGLLGLGALVLKARKRRTA